MTAVYVIQAEGGPVKIGVAMDPKKRIAALRTGTPFKLSLAYVQNVDVVSAYDVEREAHTLLASCRVHGEWFNTTLKEAKKAIATALHVVKARPNVKNSEINGTHAGSRSAAFGDYIENTIGRALDEICLERGFANRFEATCALVTEARTCSLPSLPSNPTRSPRGRRRRDDCLPRF